jgi:hypothetical protein
MGAVAGGTLGTIVATQMAATNHTVSLQQLLADTPVQERHKVVQIFRNAFHKEMMDTIQSNPELKLLVGGTSILGIVRYAVDRKLLSNDKLERVDHILRKIA